MRSLLFVPAHKEELIKKAIDSEADALILDLEDSCPGQKNKNKGIANILLYYPFNKYFIVRISTPKQLSVLGHSFNCILWPKAEFGIQVYFTDWSKDILLLTETAKGILDLSNLIGYFNVIGAAFGNEDYTADTLCTNYDFAQSTIVNTTKAYNKLAIDSVNVDVHNLGKLESDCQKAVSMGFDGKLCIHPKEVFYIHRYFTPTLREYEHCCRVVELYKQAELNGDGVAIVDGIYVAPPMVKKAEKIIKKYEYYTSKH